MTRPEYYGGPDWWGRFFSIGSLLVALAAVYFVYEQRQQTLPREEQLNQFNAGMDQWQQLANDEISAIRTEGQKAIDAERTRLNELYADLERRASPNDDGLRMASREDNSRPGSGPLSQDRGESADTSQDDPNGLFARDSRAGEPADFDLDDIDDVDNSVIEAPQEDPLGGDGNQVASEQPSLPLAMGPKLMVVRRAMRVSDDQLNRAIISNTGNEAVKITQVYFIPSEDVRIPTELRQRTGEAEGDTTSQDALAEDIARIAFGRTDNSSSIEGAHGAYRREFNEPIVILPGAELEVDIEIANRDHQGWGLLGELTLVGDGDELTLEQVTAVFRDVTGS